MNEGKPKAHNKDVSKVFGGGSESVTTPPGGGSRTAGAPVLLSGLEDQTVMDGSLATMTVEVTGDPKPTAFWLHDGIEIMESEDFHFKRNGNECQLCIRDVFPEDSGKYIFVAWNHKGVVRTEANLKVQEPAGGTRPWFIIRPKPVVTVMPGRHVLISCAIAGDPFPEFRWAKDGVGLASGGELRLVQKGNVVSLLIRRVAPHHAGQYHIRLRYPIRQVWLSHTNPHRLRYTIRQVWLSHTNLHRLRYPIRQVWLYHTNPHTVGTPIKLNVMSNPPIEALCMPQS
ncbi:myosin light chain kinase, smooth muscle-like isoform X2 [Sardina pilchardus]|uniref:myosin light chain kinase, smooth muscle-like isoform X2 n=1 Tax=Sardina pilchardus TaxID=27697 RepID=UPI002E11E32B